MEVTPSEEREVSQGEEVHLGLDLVDEPANRLEVGTKQLQKPLERRKVTRRNLSVIEMWQGFIPTNIYA